MLSCALIVLFTTKSSLVPMLVSCPTSNKLSFDYRHTQVCFQELVTSEVVWPRFRLRCHSVSAAVCRYCVLHCWHFMQPWRHCMWQSTPSQTISVLGEWRYGGKWVMRNCPEVTTVIALCWALCMINCFPVTQVHVNSHLYKPVELYKYELQTQAWQRFSKYNRTLTNNIIGKPFAPYLLTIYHPSIGISTCPNDVWTSLYIWMGKTHCRQDPCLNIGGPVVDG